VQAGYAILVVQAWAVSLSGDRVQALALHASKSGERWVCATFSSGCVRVAAFAGSICRGRGWGSGTSTTRSNNHCSRTARAAAAKLAVIRLARESGINLTVVGIGAGGAGAKCNMGMVAAARAVSATELGWAARADAQLAEERL